MLSLSKLEVKDGDILILKYDGTRYSNEQMQQIIKSCDKVIRRHEKRNKIKLTFMLLPSTEEMIKSEIIPNSAINASDFLGELESL